MSGNDKEGRSRFPSGTTERKAKADGSLTVLNGYHEAIFGARRMKSMTAAEASRHFSDLLDAVERGETITIVRGSHPVAEIGPAHRRTGADLRAAGAV